jgi:hypothetical protein
MRFLHGAIDMPWPLHPGFSGKKQQLTQLGQVSPPN